MPTLLQIGTSCNNGAPGTIAEQIGVLAQKKGWICYTAHGSRYRRPSQLNSIAITSIFQQKLHWLKSFLFDAQGLGAASETKSFISKVEKIKPDVIHLHNIHGYYINYRVLFEYLRKKDIPVIWTLHDCWPVTGHCCFFDSVDCKKWMTGCNKCPLSKFYPKSLFLDRSKQNYYLKKDLFTSIKNMNIIPVSQWLGDIVSQSYLKDFPITVIHNGIDVDVFCPSSNYKKDSKKKILGVASPWSKRKGLDDFVALCKNDNYKITLVGVSDEQIKSLPSNIIAIKRTNNQKELAKLYSEADVFVNPTYSDNFPTTNIESLACGTPVVTYKTGGSPEAIDDSTGLVVEKGDLNALTCAIDKICENGKDHYVKKCRERAVTLFDKNKVYEKYVNMYESFL